MTKTSPPETGMNRFVRPLPNILSTFRLLLALSFPFSPEEEWLWMIIAGGASDFLDGWIARRWKVESRRGGLLDAIADKLFVLSVLVTFALAGKFSLGWIPAIIARDITVASIALYIVCCRSWASFKAMGVSRFGKFATTCQFLLFLVVTLFYDFTSYILPITALFSIFAAIDYSKKFYLALRDRASEKNSNQKGSKL